MSDEMLLHRGVEDFWREKKKMGWGSGCRWVGVVWGGGGGGGGVIGRTT